MKAKIIGVCIAIMAILGHTATLDELVAGKDVEYVGVCIVDKFGQVVFERSDKAKLVQCVVGAEQSKPNLKYILLFEGEKPLRLIEFDIKEMKQRVIWTRSQV